MGIIEVSDLYKTYGQVQALDGITFEVAEGSITGFLGPNGAGKTTTIGIIMQFIMQDTGSVNVFGLDVTDNIIEIKKRLGLIADASLPTISADRLLKHTGIYAGLKGSQLTNQMDRTISLIGGASFFKRNIKTLSKGQLQRIKIANALMSDPDLIIADEPTAGLDPTSRGSLLTLFDRLSKEHGKTVFFSNHVISEVEKISDQIIMLSQGKIAAKGTIKEILSLLPSTNTYEVHAVGIDESDISNLTNVTEVIPGKDGVYTIRTNEEENNATPHFLVQLVNNPKVTVKSFRPELLDLEDVFEEVT